MLENFFPFFFLFAGLYTSWRSYDLKNNGAVVNIKVVKQKADWGPNTTFHPVFEVIDGEYAGKQAKSEFGTSFGFHSKGAVLKGRIHKRSEKIESDTTLRIMSIVSILVVICSAVYISYKFLVRA